MTDNPLVSIITVVFNGEKHLQQTIDSVAQQTYKNIEYIIIDGKSTDGTLDIIKRNESKITRWISEPDEGLYDAMNKGIDLASGELIGIVNSDDWYELDAVETVVNTYLKYDNKRIFHGDKMCIPENGKPFIRKAKNNSFLIKYHGMVLNHPTMFIHRNVYDENKYNTSLSSLSDYQFVLTNYNHDKFQFHYIPKLISNYRLGGISAKVNLLKSLKENFIARKNSGMNIFQCYFGVFLRIISETIKKVKI
ncbi:glycosyltransferase family 2 protein [Aestuariivivens sediminicola]|uniref:glycosyltransferase family 2 protein n=1 Tax=Aestuariivivens sediminicola TaxID=2913560 RepID=UPI001F58DB69|nr:glycosyltransferase family 2 protein [Aestuariivivens sediminicola]